MCSSSTCSGHETLVYSGTLLLAPQDHLTNIDLIQGHLTNIDHHTDMIAQGIRYLPKTSKLLSGLQHFIEGNGDQHLLQPPPPPV